MKKIRNVEKNMGGCRGNFAVGSSSLFLYQSGYRNSSVFNKFDKSKPAG